MTDSRDSIVEQRMRQALAERPAETLAPVHQWARSLRTSTRRVSRVMRRLRDEGLIDFARGRRAQPVAALRSPAASRTGPTETVCRHVRGMIEDGHYPMGSPLPKAEYFAVELGVSRNTVRAALARLSRQGLLHRQRRSMVAGPALPSGVASGRRAAPVIVMLQADEDWWATALQNDRLAPFSHGLMRDVSMAGVQLAPVFLHQTRSPYLVHGDAAIARLIAELGQRYRGTLLIGQSWDFRHYDSAAIVTLIRRAASYGEPVVWLDHSDEPVRAAWSFERAAYDALTREPRVAQLFTRVHHSEAAGARLAIEVLRVAGHRRAGLPWFSGDDKVLYGIRSTSLGQAAAEANGMALVERQLPGNPFGEADPVAPATLPAGLRRLMPAQGRRLVSQGVPADADGRRLLRLAEALVTLIHQDAVTAIVAVNDTRAHHYYLCLRALGYRVPEDISLISFDANPRHLYPWPISSVDFGFVNLGYCAYHLLMGDVPIERARCAVRARCRLNHPGSIGAPAARG